MVFDETNKKIPKNINNKFIYMKRLWFYVVNTFLTAGRNSFKKVLSIAGGHVSMLDAKKSDADILLMFNRISPVCEFFSNLYATWLAYKGAVSAETQRFKELLNQFQPKMYNWDLQIQLVFPEKSSDYTFLFPNGKKPFYNGTYDQRVSAIETLSLNLKEYASLAAIQLEVKKYFDDLKSARNVQQKKIGLLKEKAHEMKSAHVALANLLYANLGLLMNKYANEPEKIQAFFDLELLRSHKSKDDTVPSDTFMLSIPTNINKEAGISFEVDSTLLFYNDSNVPLEVYTAADKNDPIPAQTITIDPDEEKELNVNELGAPGNRFLFVVNHDLNEVGKMEITLVK